MSTTILFYRGAKRNLAKAMLTMVEREPFLCEDTNELYICCGPDQEPYLVGKLPYHEVILRTHADRLLDIQGKKPSWFQKVKALVDGVDIT